MVDRDPARAKRPRRRAEWWDRASYNDRFSDYCRRFWSRFTMQEIEHIISNAGIARQRVYYYDRFTKTAKLDDPRVPWAVAMHLAFRSSKHIFASSRDPSAAVLYRSFDTFSRKLRWADFFMDKPDEPGDPSMFGLRAPSTSMPKHREVA